MHNYWQVYDRLIELADAHDTIAELSITSSWMFLKTASGRIGTAMTLPGNPFDETALRGQSLRDAAMLVKSWNYREASVGMAAINACLNQYDLFQPQNNPDAFLRYKDRYIGKKVAVVGHFAYLEERLKGKCSLYVLERHPVGDDIPDPACEYLLPAMDCVIITGSAFTNKTMPRLLDLSRDAFTVISGPSTPMSPMLFDYGVDALCGFCVTDDRVFSSSYGKCAGIFQYGEMVCRENFI